MSACTSPFEPAQQAELARRLVSLTEGGLPLVDDPWGWLAERLELSVEATLALLQQLQADGAIRRIAAVPNHYRLGYRHNGMTVWDVDDGEMARLGPLIGAQAFVSHCYRRPRQDGWCYNLFAMVHGRSAEEIAFGQISTGAQNDLQRATDIARAMVTEFGMSEELGVVNYAGHKRAAFLEMPFAQERGDYAEETARKIDAEVKRILNEAHETARRLLRERRDVLDRLSERLLDKEVVESEELLALLGNARLLISDAP